MVNENIPLDTKRLECDAQARWDPGIISHRSLSWRFGAFELLTRRIRQKSDSLFEQDRHYLIANPARVECRLGAGPLLRSKPVCFLPGGTRCWGWVDARVRHSYAMLSIDPAFVAHVSQERVDLDRLEFKADFDVRSACIERAFRRLKQEMASPDGRLLAESVLAEVVDCLLETSSNLSLRNTHRGGLTRRALHRVREYVEENLQSNVGLSELAAVAALSPTHFIRAFRRTTGMPPVAFLAERRVARARGLLEGDVLSLAEVARRCGYSSQSYFSTRFARATGVSPGVYRASMRADKARGAGAERVAAAELL